MSDQILCGDAREVMAEMEPESIHMCVTSPPYLSLRDYGLSPLVWGGEEGCEHEWGDEALIEKQGNWDTWQATNGGTPDRFSRKKATGGTSQGQFCLRCGAWRGSLGLEPSVELYRDHIREIFGGEENPVGVWRVLRPDGLLFLNMGSSYATHASKRSGQFGRPLEDPRDAPFAKPKPKFASYKELDLIPLPWLVALALQRDGWYLRSDIIWVKGKEPEWDELEDGQSIGAGMPSSVAGWRWERHRVKVKAEDKSKRTEAGTIGGMRSHSGSKITEAAKWADCPGCLKCEPNDGLVLRRGAWRPTTAHEYVFLLTKTDEYYCDQEAVREAHKEPWRSGKPESATPHTITDERGKMIRWVPEQRRYNPAGRNKRSVWFITSRGLSLPHFAAFPPKLPELCIRIGTSERGVCPECGAPWARVVNVTYTPAGGRGQEKYTQDFRQKNPGHATPQEMRLGRACKDTQTLGWRPTCDCHRRLTTGKIEKYGLVSAVWRTIKRDYLKPIPATVLDPFVGSGTTCIVAKTMGRDSVGIDLSEKYVKMTEERLAKIPGHQLKLMEV